MEVKNKRVLIIGIARSGISSAKLCQDFGAQVTLYDSKNSGAFQETLLELKDYPFQYLFGSFDLAWLAGFDILVMSPGVPTDLPFVLQAKRMGIELIGEIELAAGFNRAPIIAITGTNGKTTTTSLVGQIVAAYNPDTYVVGNIGNPFADIAAKTTRDSMVVAEISSFQLETVAMFKPKISAILNITEDHLNRHKTMENYIEAKVRIAENQGESDFCILNADDPYLLEMDGKFRCTVLWFSMNKVVKGVYYRDHAIYMNWDTHTGILIDMKKVGLLGAHNIENIMAAALICLVAGVPVEKIQDGTYAFKGVEHRIEFCAEVLGVKYYNDSKATNPDAAIKGIQAMITPTLLLAGGMDKHSNYDPWIEAFDGKVKMLLLYGETKHQIEESAKRMNFIGKIEIFDTMNQALERAMQSAVSGDCVLLSPACASWDQFESYEKRGELFKKIVSTF